MPAPLAPLFSDGALSADDWLLLVHPALMILFVYPVVGATIRLGILVRERRLDLNPIAATVPAEHVDHGRWVATGAVVASLLALAANLARARAAGAATGAGLWAPGQPFAALALAALGLSGCLALWRVRSPRARALSAVLSIAGLTILALQPPLWFQGISPWSRLWGSHTWGGLLLLSLLLFAMAAAPEIRHRAAWRRLHTAAAVLTALLLAVQAISGSRDLLVLGLGTP
ncbi:MAG: DUF4079 family protein [Synechococcaceae cyanobacterium]|nr:DUF4079 family protein [Synechococcaceae cyanobacterium]